jgi:hypothetical protein
MNKTPTMDAVWCIENFTPRPIWLEHGDRVFTLAPFDKRTWSASLTCGEEVLDAPDPRTVFPQLQRLVDRHQVGICRQMAEPRDRTVARSVRVAVIAGFLWLVALWPLSPWWWQRIGGVLAIGCALYFLVLFTSPSRGQNASRRRTVSGLGGVRQLRRWTWYNATMVVVVAIGVLLPAVVLYLATDLNRVISFAPNGFHIDTSQPLILIGRAMQLTFISVATLLPALMYFQFDAERLGTLRDRWIQNVFRLDPTVSTMSDVLAKYGKQLDEAYGNLGDGRGRLTRGRRSPIIVTTLILGFGWLLILLKAGDKIDINQGNGSLSFVTLLDPDQSLVAFAFLGAYFFALQLVWRGYVRTDLRPKTYTTITVRVLVVVIISWLIEATMGGGSPEPLYLLAFAAGLVPDSVLHLIWEKVLPRLGKVLNQDRQQQLTELEGIDLYERTRLSEEGITSIEALAHHDVLDLFFKTRISAARLVDWVDQAILVMYLGFDRQNTTPATANEPDPDKVGGPPVKAQRTSGSSLRLALRALGIRTASDLVYLTRRSTAGNLPAGEAVLEDLVDTLEHLMPTEHCRDLKHRLCVIATTLDHSEWIGRIENWRRSDLIEADKAKRRYVDGQGDLRFGDPRLSAVDATTQAGQRWHQQASAAVFAAMASIITKLSNSNAVHSRNRFRGQR